MVPPKRLRSPVLRRQNGSLCLVRAALLVLLAGASALALGSCAKDASETAYGGGGFSESDSSTPDTSAAADAKDSSKPDSTTTPEAGIETGSPEASSCVPKTCAQLGAECGNAPDGCGGKVACGTCATGKQCGGGGVNKCGTNECTPKTCSQLSASCGTVSDSCADVLDCGKCNAPSTCGGGGKPNQCGCAAKTCAQLGATCGSVPDGCGSKIDCGACASGETCGGGGVANKCGKGTCAAKTCAQLAASCGFVSDGCGVALECGTCAAPNTCGGGGTANQCGCVPKTCGQLNATCGPVPNECGQTLDCGTCPTGEVCGGGGTPHQCGCTCTIPHALTTCTKGVCTMVKCEDGWANCDGDEKTGCEIQTSTDPNNCGLCAKKCTFSHAKGTCNAGTCALGACDKSWNDCNANPVDGCEQASDVKHCGSCTNDCTAKLPPQVATATCTNDKCAIGTCAANTVDQNDTYNDGCECTADGVPSTCATAQVLGANPLPLGGTGNASGTLVPDGQNDWYTVNFSGNSDCQYHPKVTLQDQSGTGLIRLDVATNCSAAYLDCSEGGESSAKLNWEFTYTTGETCGEFLNLDPTRFASLPNKIYIRVYATASSTTCLPYTLTVTN